MGPAIALEHTLLALRSVASGGGQVDDGIVLAVERFLRDLSVAKATPDGMDALRAAVEDWLGQMIGPLFARIERRLETASGPDLTRVREVLRAI
jgi:hypothetical protein